MQSLTLDALGADNRRSGPDPTVPFLLDVAPSMEIQIQHAPALYPAPGQAADGKSCGGVLGRPLVWRAQLGQRGLAALAVVSRTLSASRGVRKTARLLFHRLPHRLRAKRPPAGPAHLRASEWVAREAPLSASPGLICAAEGASPFKTEAVRATLSAAPLAQPAPEESGGPGRAGMRRGRAARRMAGEGPAQSRPDTKAAAPTPAAPLKLERTAGIPEVARSCCRGGRPGPVLIPRRQHTWAQPLSACNCRVSRFPPALKLH